MTNEIHMPEKRQHNNETHLMEKERRGFPGFKGESRPAMRTA